MKKKLAVTILSLLFLAIFPLNSLAETLLEKIERTGVMNAGARKKSIPFGYESTDDQWTGYSVDLIKLIHQKLEKKLNKSIELNLTEVNVDDRFELIQDGTLEIVCGATSITPQRLEIVDFSIPFFLTGTQFLVRREYARWFDFNDGLQGKSIAYIPQTTTDQLIRPLYPLATWQNVQDRPDGIYSLMTRKVQAFAGDGILLVGEVVRQGSNPKNFALVPREPMTSELYGCILPKNTTEWKYFIDMTIAGDENTELQRKWFDPETGLFPYLLRRFR